MLDKISFGSHYLLVHKGQPVINYNTARYMIEALQKTEDPQVAWQPIYKDDNRNHVIEENHYFTGPEKEKLNEAHSENKKIGDKGYYDFVRNDKTQPLEVTVLFSKYMDKIFNKVV